MDHHFWKKCSVCKNEIKFSSVYQVCSITSCKKHSFCSVDCWDIHNSTLLHRNAYAQEEMAPAAHEVSYHEASQEGTPTLERVAKRIIVKPSLGTTSSHSHDSSKLPHDVLIVASKLKSYIKAKADMNTSAGVIDILSDIVRDLSNQAIEQARAEGRKTVMDRDFSFYR